MSYNCDTWKLKRIENLRIPIASLFKHERSDWHPKKIDGGECTSYEVSKTCFIRGRIVDDFLLVTDFECYGEGSGTAMAWIFEPALKDSTGLLEASTVWEGGDSIKKLIAQDGEVTWEEIEI